MYTDAVLCGVTRLLCTLQPGRHAMPAMQSIRAPTGQRADGGITPARPSAVHRASCCSCRVETESERVAPLGDAFSASDSGGTHAVPLGGRFMSASGLNVDCTSRPRDAVWWEKSRTCIRRIHPGADLFLNAECD